MVPWVRMNPYLLQDNPYSGNVWQDDIAPDVLEFQRLTLKYNYGLSINKAQLTWLYNKTMFEENGWEPPAEDKYSEFQTLIANIKEAGIIPFASYATAWGMFTDHPIRAYLNSLQRPQWTEVAGSPDVRWLTTQQTYEGFYCGIFDYTYAGVQLAFELAKYLNKHAPPGHWSLDKAQAYELFYTEKAAILWELPRQIPIMDQPCSSQSTAYCRETYGIWEKSL